VKVRVVIVKGKKGMLQKSFKHIPVDIKIVEENGEKKIIIEMWFGSYQAKAAVKTVQSAINNMIVGVTKGHKYKMKAVYAHFPITLTVLDKGKTIEIRNFVGERQVKKVTMLPGCEAKKNEATKDQIEIEGIDLDNVSQTCTLTSKISYRCSNQSDCESKT
jgi:large subunit ribosomal protein L9e